MAKLGKRVSARIAKHQSWIDDACAVRARYSPQNFQGFFQRKPVTHCGRRLAVLGFRATFEAKAYSVTFYVYDGREERAFATLADAVIAYDSVSMLGDSTPLTISA